jgi:hypothetical protein
MPLRNGAAFFVLVPELARDCSCCRSDDGGVGAEICIAVLHATENTRTLPVSNIPLVLLKKTGTNEKNRTALNRAGFELVGARGFETPTTSAPCCYVNTRNFNEIKRL